MGKAKVVAEGMKKIGNKVAKKRMVLSPKDAEKLLIKNRGLVNRLEMKFLDSPIKKNMAASQAKKTILSPKTQARNKTPIKPKKKADGGMMKYKDGGSVSPKRSSKKGTGAAVRGFGKALR